MVITRTPLANPSPSLQRQQSMDPSLFENPVKLFREEHNMTQEELANKAGIHRNVVTRTEGGMYSHIPTSILYVIQDYSPTDYHLYEPMFQDWINNELSFLKQDTKLNYRHVYSFDSFMKWRQWVSPSVSGFAKLLKLQDVIINNYQNGKTQSLPVPLRDRLISVGWSVDAVQFLAELPRR